VDRAGVAPLPRADQVTLASPTPPPSLLAVQPSSSEGDARRRIAPGSTGVPACVSDSRGALGGTTSTITDMLARPTWPA
jgi:hypothetical protein